jgi:antiviral helicase SKI2
VRGKSNYFPFTPGGLGPGDGENVVIDEGNEDQDVEEIMEDIEKGFEAMRGMNNTFHPKYISSYSLSSGGIRTIPPGFTRGLDFSLSAGEDGSVELLEDSPFEDVEPIYTTSQPPTQGIVSSLPPSSERIRRNRQE